MIYELEPRDWDRRLAEIGLDDAYFSSGYVAAAALLDGGRPVLLGLRGTGGEVLFPCVVRPLPSGESGVDVVSPYGYGGPIAIGEQPPVGDFENGYEEWCRENAVVTTFIRFHPLLRNHAYAPRATSLTQLAGTVVWSVAGGRDLFASMQSRYRRAIKAMAKQATTAVARGDAALDRFRALYEQTMRRNGAAPFYFFPTEYWRTLLDRLGENARFFEVTQGEELIASMLVIGGRPWLHCHLLGMSDAGRATQAGKLIYFEVARWAQQEGFEAIHLGGGVGCRDDSLLAFKLGFAQDGLTPAYVGKIVHDAVQYKVLAGSDRTDGFFPAYRRASG